LIEKEVPEGRIVREGKGSAAALKRLLALAKAQKVTGYVRTIAGRTGAKGFILILEGVPKVSVYERSDGSVIYGQQAVRRTWEDSYDDKTHLALVEADVDAVVEKYITKGKIELSKRKTRVVALAWGAKEREAKKERMEERLEERIAAIKAKGYDASELENLLEGREFDALEKKLQAFEARIAKVESIKTQLERFKGAGMEREQAEKMLHTLVEKMRTQLAKEKESVKVQKQIAQQKAEIESREARKAFVYELITKQAKMEKMGEVKDEKAEAEIAAVTAARTFDNFVVGESNRFAYSAARAVAERPGIGYNPLFIWSGPGLGKTHLLCAIAHELKKKMEEKKVLYITTEKFTNDLINALQNNTILQFRQYYRSVDVLIVDDIQFLAGRERSQEEFFHTFNTLYTVDKQIVLASDRPPKEIPKLEERLVSRFEGGLIAHIQPPELETRIAILKQKAEENDWDVPMEVLRYIAELFSTNIRELEGGLKKVMAFSSLMKKEVTLDLAKEVLRDVKPPKKEVVGREVEEREEKKAEEMEFLDGHSYIIEERRASKCFEMLSQFEKERAALCITRLHPRRIKERYKLENTEIFWLTDRESKTVPTLDYGLERIMYTVEEFIGKESNGIVLLDGLTYLINNNSFDAVLSFMRRIIDQVSETSCIFMVSITPETMEPQELRILEREMEIADYTS